MEERKDPVNWSTLKWLRQSPKHYLYALEHPRPDSEALLLGRLTHCAVYEPDRLASRYLIAPRFHGGMKDATALANGYDGGKEAKAAWEVTLAESSAEAVPADLLQRAVACRDALLADPIASSQIRGGYIEQPLTWTDASTGIQCRGRVDHVNGCLSDLKTTRSVEPRVFNRDAARYGYHGQIAFYEAGLEANSIATIGPPMIIAVESVPPHDVIVLEFSDAALWAGRQLYRSCLDALARCRETGTWPGVAGGKVLPLELPAWATPESEEITLGGVSVF